MIEYAMKLGYIERKPNPCQYVDTPQRVQKEVEVYTAEEIKKILQTMEKEDDIMLYFAVSMAAACELRRSEISGLKLQDFDFKENQLKISRARVYADEGDVDKETKTRSGRRSIVIPAQITEIVKQIKRYKMSNRVKYGHDYIETDYLYVAANGAPLSVSSISGHWARWLEKHTEFKHVSFHGLRHTYCSLMLSYGIDPRALADQMGHSNPAISLNIYAHSYTESKIGYVNKLNEALYSASANE
ncbi:MAG: site-specific integrase [Lachnospiraceae bacterium]|nr:site-specific integrase [Lachnospiraceae bacterium]